MIFYIEGPDLSGKTTLINNISQRLKRMGYECKLLKEPSGLTRELILSSNEYMDEEAERLYFLANHIKVLSEANTLLLDNPDLIILIDRCAIISDFIQSEIASADKGARYLGRIKNNVLKNSVTKDIEKHLILLKLNQSLCLRRIKERSTLINDKNDKVSDKTKLEIARKYLNLKRDKLLVHFNTVQKFNSGMNKLELQVISYILRLREEKYAKKNIKNS